MNKEKIKKNVGNFVRLIPIAHRLDIRGNPLPQIDDEWQIEAVTDAGVRIFLPRTGHGRTLGFDHIHQYTSDRIERGVSYGFLTLNVQLSIQGNDVGVTPTRPGETVRLRIPPDPIRLALFQQLHQSPGRAVMQSTCRNSRLRRLITKLLGATPKECSRPDCFRMDAASWPQWPCGSNGAASSGCNNSDPSEPYSASGHWCSHIVPTESMAGLRRELSGYFTSGDNGLD
jgi:hypothetical protein